MTISIPKPPLPPLNDNETFRRYGQGYASKGDWRRHNTQQLIAQVFHHHQKAQSERRVWREPGRGVAQPLARSGGSDTRARPPMMNPMPIPAAWVQQGLLDYIAPQIYWPFARDAARYDVLANWWAEVVKPTHTRPQIGVALYKVGEPSKNEPDWTVDGGVPELKSSSISMRLCRRSRAPSRSAKQPQSAANPAGG